MLLLFCVTCWVNLHYLVWVFWWLGGGCVCEGTGIKISLDGGLCFGSIVSWGCLSIRGVYPLLSKYSQKALSLSHRMSHMELGTTLLHLKVLKHLACTFPLIHNYLFIFLNCYAIKWNGNRI